MRVDVAVRREKWEEQPVTKQANIGGIGFAAGFEAQGWPVGGEA